MQILKLKSYDETLSIIKDLVRSDALAVTEVELLLSEFDNERPNYALGQNLEIGGILLNGEEIADLAKKQAHTLASEIDDENPITLFWSQWSAQKYVNQLSGFLRSVIPNEVKVIGVKTSWVMEGVVSGPSIPIILPDRNSLVYCVDFLVGSGGTLKYLHDILRAGGIEARKSLVMIDKPTRNKVFSPALIKPYMFIEDDYWTFGYGSDAKANGLEVGRTLPFFACLVPKGQGMRERLKAELRQ